MLDLELKPGDAMDHSRWKADQGVYTHTHTHTILTAIFSGEPG